MFNEKLNNLRDDIKRHRDFIKAEYDNKPEGSLNFINIKGQTKIKYVTRKNGQRSMRDISNESSFVSSMMKFSRIEYELKQLNESIELLDIACGKLAGCDYSSQYKRLVLEYPKADPSLIMAAMNDMPADLSWWMNEPYERSAYMQEKLTQPTNFGIKVRSKNEALIGNSLFLKNVPFRYEEVLHFNDGKFLVPDFTIVNYYKKKFYWEHCGMMEDPEYYERWRKKELLYHRHGIVQWDNLIVTFDRPDGSIDMEEVEFIIKNRLLRS